MYQIRETVIHVDSIKKEQVDLSPNCLDLVYIISRYHVDIIQRAHFIFTEEQYIENIFGSFKENTNVYYFYF